MNERGYVSQPQFTLFLFGNNSIHVLKKIEIDLMKLEQTEKKNEYFHSDLHFLDVIGYSREILIS